MKSKKILATVLILAVLLLTGCGDNATKMEISELENREYNEDGSVIVPKGYIVLELYGKDGEVIIESVQVKYKENISVADVSREVCRYKNIPFVLSGVGSLTYVQGINNLFERDHGAESGWLYAVNGEYQGVSCWSYTLDAGDYIEWRYTLDLGKDLGAYELGE